MPLVPILMLGDCTWLISPTPPIRSLLVVMEVMGILMNVNAYFVSIVFPLGLRFIVIDILAFLTICFADDTGPDSRYIKSEICFNYNVDTLTIVDVTNKAAPRQLSRIGYSGSAYTHQGWLTDDRTHVIVNDEQDEDGAVNTKSHVFNVKSLTNPTYVGYHSGTTKATDHNLYIKDNLVFQANFRAGLQVLRINNLDSASLTQVGHFDIYPSSNSDTLNGAWGNYPYFSSGNIIVSGIEQGLYVLKSPNNFGLTPMPISPTAYPTSAKPTFSSRPTAMPSTSGPTSAKPTSSRPTNRPTTLKPTLPQLTAGQRLTLSISSVGANQMYYIAVPRSNRVTCRTTGTSGSSSGDPDLYVKFGSQPTLTSYVAVSKGNSYVEVVGPLAASTSADRTLYVMVYAWSAFVNVQLWCDLITNSPSASPTTRKPTLSPTTRKPSSRRPT